MSGIVGIYSPHQPSLAQAEMLEPMMEAISHRGTSGKSLYLDPDHGLALGSLFGPSAVKNNGENPAFHEDERCVVSLDGTIFNAMDLVSIPPDRSAAALAACWHQHGREAAVHLDGPCVFAVWEKKKRALSIVRDPLGVKPLYWSYESNQGLLTFSSELKGILAHPCVPRELDQRGLTCFLTFGYIPAPYSIIQSCQKLFPGTILTQEEGLAPTTSRYWSMPDLNPDPDDLPVQSAASRQNILARFEAHVGSAKKVGVFLSGGLDSTIALAALTTLGVPDIHTFSLGLAKRHPRINLAADLPFASMAARHFGSSHHEILLAENHDPKELLDQVWRQFDEPILTPNTYSKYFLSREAKRHGCDLCFSGLGGEDLFYGISPGIKKRMARRFRPGDSELDGMIRRYGRAFSIDLQQRLLVEPVDDPWEIALTTLTRYNKDVQSTCPLDRFLLTVLRVMGSEKSIAVQDRTSVLNQVEVRHPFQDPKLLKFSRTLSPDRKYNSETDENRFFLVDAFRRDLPREILEREKAGYPSYYWNQGEVDFLTDLYLSPAGVESSGIFRTETVDEILKDDLQSNNKSAGKRTWALLVLQAWYENYMRKVPN